MFMRVSFCRPYICYNTRALPPPLTFFFLSGIAGVLYIGRDFDCWRTSRIKQEIGATSSNYTGSLSILFYLECRSDLSGIKL